VEQFLAYLRRFMTESIPFNRYLGITVTAAEVGFVRLEVPFRPEFVGDPVRPALHGGIISTLIDTCGGAAVWSALSPQDRVSTVDLRVDYLRPGEMAALIAEGTVVRLGNRVGVVDIRVFHPGREQHLIATGKGVYNIRRVRGETDRPEPGGPGRPQPAGPSRDRG